MKLGWSNFAAGRHAPGRGYSYFNGDNDELIEVVRENWDKRRPGNGRTDLDKVVVVPVPPQDFVGTTVTIREGMTFEASLFRRQPQESPFIKVVAKTCLLTDQEMEKLGIEKQKFVARPSPDPVNFASVVMYSAAALLENDGERSGDFDWEVVAIIASAVENEPMHPLALVRNYLQKPGGTAMPLTLEMLAESVWYWSDKVSI